MTTEAEAKVTVASISLMRRGVLEEERNTMAPCGDSYRPRECDEDELHRELDSGKMSMYTEVRVSGSWLCLDNGMVGPSRYCGEDIEEQVSRRVSSN